MTGMTEQQPPAAPPPPGRKHRTIGAVPAARNAPRALDAHTQPDLKRAAPAAVIALIGYALGQGLGGIGRSAPVDFDALAAAIQRPAGPITSRVTCPPGGGFRGDRSDIASRAIAWA